MQKKKFDIFKPWETLDPWQEKYINTKGNCFLLCGRQSGKTTAASIKFGRRAVENKNQIILMIAYTEKQAYALFFKTLLYLRENHPKAVVEKGGFRPTKHEINLKNGSKIMCYAAGLSGEGIRTYTITSLVIDEAAPMAREVFIAVSPMLSVTGGSLDILSTPRGKEGFFYECSKKDNFTKFYVSAEDCPRHDKEFLKQEKESMSELEYAQEYLAKFLDELRQFFPNDLIKKVCTGKRSETILPADYYLGCDVARKDKDEFSYEILDGTDKENLVHVENIVTKNIPIPESTRRIISLNKQYDFVKEYIDSGGMGISVVDLLREDENNKRKVVEINNSSRRYVEDGVDKKQGILKEDLYENLIMLMEQGRIILLDDEDVIASLQSVQYEILNGKIRIFGNYTHIVEGLIRAAWCAKSKSLNPCII